MTKTGKCILAGLIVVLGILLIAFQDAVIKIVVSALGILLIALGVIDFFNKMLTSALIKGILGVVVILFGIFAVRAVLYLVAGALLIVGILLLYERFKSRVYCQTSWQKILSYVLPSICLAIGFLLLFNGGKSAQWVFIVSGVFVVVEGGLLLVDALVGD